MSRQKVVDSMITGTISASKLDGALPAINGANLTGVGDGVLKGGNDPAIDTNPAAGVGAVWLNTSSGEMFVCTDATTDANVWTNVGGGVDGVAPASWYGNTGIVQGGSTANNNHYVTDISSWNITTLGNASDWGFDNTQGRRHGVSMSDASRIVSMGGIWGWSTFYNTIDYITVASAANAQSFGNAIRSDAAFGGASDGVRGVAAGDYASSGDIQYVTIQTPGNAIDFGANLVVAGYQMSGQSNGTRGVFCGGLRTGSSTKMDYVTIQTAGTCTEFGDVAEYNTAACVGNTSDGTRGVILDCAENSPHRHQYITIATLGNAQIFGDRGRLGYGGTSAGNGIRAVEMGGWVPGNVHTNAMDYVTIQTLGNAQTFGNLDRNCGTGWGSSGN